MALEGLRDVIIVIFGVLGIVALITLIAILIVLYRKIAPILETVRNVLGDVRGTSSFVSDTMVKPVAKLVSIVTGTRKAIEILLKLSRGKGDKRRGK